MKKTIDREKTGDEIQEVQKKNQSPIFIVGRKVNLRPLSKSDIPKIVCWINDPEVRKFIGNNFPLTEKKEEDWLDNLDSNSKSGNMVLAIETKDGVHIGNMGVHDMNWVDRVCTTGAMIGEKQYWGKGYGTDAKMYLLHHLFDSLNVHKVCSRVFSFNRRSLQYSLHCGYKVEGLRKAHVFKSGRYYDVIELGLFRKDWLPIWRHYKKTGLIR